MSTAPSAPVTADAVASVLDAVDAGLDASLDRLFALLAIPSVSTDPAFHADCVRAAEWLCTELTGLGFEARVHPTTGKPMVLAHYTPEGPAAERPRLLFYGHYDVQPADPLELWETGPFEPRLKEVAPGRRQIVARGAVDDKGQLMTFVEACRAWIATHGALPCPVTVFFEGEEESGSPSLMPFLDSHRDALAADVGLICDTAMWDRDTPAITVMLRGLVGEEVTVQAADRDLHSGVFGNAARNPNHVLGRIVGDLFDDQGRVQVPGFYDGVEDAPGEIREQWAALDFDPAAFLGTVDLSVPAGEADRSVLEQVWSRPTAEVNGMIGGYTGDGFKTVIPAEARAKISFRLVAGQDPEAVRAGFRRFVRERLPADCTARFDEHGGSPATVVDIANPFLTTARAQLTAEFEREAVLIGSGGSIPIAGAFKDVLGIDSLLIGFGLDDDRMHSPNEKYELSSFHHGTRFWARFLAANAG
ncbi:acetylornithine deacetylase/succinyl-diaminopimelate desuccinylase-like protein [Rhodothalassium salexigens DSM 2132]|uniref:Acetylornithine deacetylase/succinyl-diaminopimelate desuccinylase-like protein n=1 Tax=Rhodothalassium salexigens DSM 2132 TaxID=1188247 RepID=A0A4R2PR90_RHOSA|nr:M20/M25/M40 family metallo-hydrolase [Rhodothalassium salexigens]MBB4210208.1 acetylornithine deacetylase/succinyl-diaminopimelate desuccinylase-like protein [Rhodothalassium salexigens DSM 2132]MBK1638528.1 hypothetical protein [Rhodothalassium salexigens DSM 2132]TCP38372.1 acetylornithine deacetylase/succinyl-diaminopimelate desuccinylase-like protein [Rhodothalassium salexigens DSM 2132]